MIFGTRQTASTGPRGRVKGASNARCSVALMFLSEPLIFSLQSWGHIWPLLLVLFAHIMQCIDFSGLCTRRKPFGCVVDEAAFWQFFPSFSVLRQVECL